MIAYRENRNSTKLGIEISSEDSGCCPQADLSACRYAFEFASAPTYFSAISIAGNSYAFTHTYVDPISLAVALIDFLRTPTSQGGPGIALEEGDVKAYMNTFAVGGSKLTLELISGLVINSITSNLGTNTGSAKCSTFLGCLHVFDYTLSDAITISIGGVALTLTTYATAALLRTAVQGQIVSQSLTNVAVAQARTSATAGHADLWLWVKPGEELVINGDVIPSEGVCNIQYH